MDNTYQIFICTSVGHGRCSEKKGYSSSFPLTGRLANKTSPFKIYLRQTRTLNGSWQHWKTDETREKIAAIKHGFQLSESNRLGCKEPQKAFLFGRDEIIPTRILWRQYIVGILPKGPYLPCVNMTGRAPLAGYHRYNICSSCISQSKVISMTYQADLHGRQNHEEIYMN